MTNVYLLKKFAKLFLGIDSFPRKYVEKIKEVILYLVTTFVEKASF
jgi:hypothetical protein